MTLVVSMRMRVHRAAFLACLIAAGVLAASAAPASAIMVKLSHGYANYAPMSGAQTSPGPRNFDQVFTNLDYSGGPVMPSNDNVVVVWQPSNYTGTPFQSGTGSQLDYVPGVEQFLSDLAHDSGTSANSDAVSTQYNDTSGATAAYASSYGGSVVDSDPLPPNGCPADAGHICITDAQIQAELDNFLSAGGYPADLKHEYYLLTPPDVASCFDAAGDECSANADSPTQYKYCAYHTRSALDGYVYANIPDAAGVDGCDPFATWWYYCPDFSCSYNNGPADGVLSAVSHEHNESITDPEPNNAWTDWGSSVGGEIGDKCNNDGFDDPKLQFGGDSGDAPYNETINGNRYLLQREWSNQTHSCLDAFSPSNTAASASFTVSGGSGNTVNFDATASTATGGVTEYVWQFNDGANVQNNTVETTSPTISHPFPATGTYTVALTVMAPDGTSNGTSKQVVVGGSRQAPTAAFTAPSGLEGTSLSFDGSASTDPNPAGSITSYAWTFGDGATGSSAKTTHTYAKYGTYTATLTVTDSAGLTNTVSHTVTVSDEPPTAAFTVAPSSPTQGSPASFDATGSHDPDGTITGYAWNFGDTTTATGPTATHTYAAPGSYTATLTVTDSDGQTATISHTITVAAAQPPTAAFTAPSGLEANALSFDGSTSTDPNPGGSITSYAWTFGDGATGSSAKTTHTYAKYGTYTATLTVTDSAGLTNTVSHTVTVSDETPTAAFTAPTGLAKSPVHFAGAGSDPDGTITAYRWGFGDGSGATGAKASHTYTKSGSYLVKLTVTDSDGQTATVSHWVKIAPSCVVPNLIGKTLAQTKTALSAANCTLAKVPPSPPKPTSSPGANKHWALVVGSQSPAAGKVLPKASAVSVKLVWKAIKN